MTITSRINIIDNIHTFFSVGPAYRNLNRPIENIDLKIYISKSLNEKQIKAAKSKKLDKCLAGTIEQKEEEAKKASRERAMVRIAPKSQEEATKLEDNIVERKQVKEDCWKRMLNGVILNNCNKLFSNYFNVLNL